MHTREVGVRILSCERSALFHALALAEKSETVVPGNGFPSKAIVSTEGDTLAFTIASMPAIAAMPSP